MSNRESRARNRRAKMKMLIDDARRERIRFRVGSHVMLRAEWMATNRLVQALKELANSPFQVWDVLDGLNLDDEDRALIAEIVAPPLAGCTPGNVHRRYEGRFKLAK